MGACDEWQSVNAMPPPLRRSSSDHDEIVMQAEQRAQQWPGVLLRRKMGQLLAFVLMRFLSELNPTL